MKRALLVIAIALYFVVVLVWLGRDKRIATHALDDFSIANSGPKGTSLASKYLARSGRRVEPLSLAMNSRSTAPRATVFRLGAPPPLFKPSVFEEEKDRKKPKPRTRYVTPLLNDEEEAWVRKGGRLIIASEASFGSLIVGSAPEKLARKVFPLWAGLDTLDLPESRAVGGEALRNAHAVYTAGESTVVARVAVGAGEVLVFGCPEALENDHLAKHLALLLALAGDANRIYFDETIHGMSTGQGALAVMKEWKLGPFLLLLLVIAAVTFWRGSTRIGTPDDELRDTRSDAIDLVASLGALYDRSMTNAEALAAYRHELTRAVAASSGLRGEALQKRVADLTNGMEVPDLATLNAAFQRLGE